MFEASGDCVVIASACPNNDSCLVHTDDKVSHRRRGVAAVWTSADTNTVGLVDRITVAGRWTDRQRDRRAGDGV